MDLGTLRTITTGAAVCLFGFSLFVGLVSLIWIVARRTPPTLHPAASPSPASDALKTSPEFDVRIRPEVDNDDFHLSVTGSGSTLLGRSPNAGTVLALNEYSGVSRVHARLEMRDGALFVSDLESRNGTWINGRRLASGQPHELRAGDVLNLGRTRLIVDAVNLAPAPAERIKV